MRYMDGVELLNRTARVGPRRMKVNQGDLLRPFATVRKRETMPGCDLFFFRSLFVSLWFSLNSNLIQGLKIVAIRDLWGNLGGMGSVELLIEKVFFLVLGGLFFLVQAEVQLPRLGNWQDSVTIFDGLSLHRAREQCMNLVSMLSIHCSTWCITEWGPTEAKISGLPSPQSRSPPYHYIFLFLNFDYIISALFYHQQHNLVQFYQSAGIQKGAGGGQKKIQVRGKNVVTANQSLYARGDNHS